MNTRSILCVALGIWAALVGAPQAGAVVFFDNGAVNNVDWAIPDDVIVQDSFSGNTTTVNLLSGGQVSGYLHAYQSSQVNISGGSLGVSLKAHNSSCVNFSAGSMNGQLVAYDSTQVNVSGGSIGTYLVTTGGSYVTVSGGSISRDLYVYESSQVTVSGGAIGGEFSMQGDTITTIVGTDFAIDGTPVGYGQYDRGLQMFFHGVLTGTLDSGDPLNNQFVISDNARMVLVPEPASAALLLIGLPWVLLRRLRTRRVLPLILLAVCLCAGQPALAADVFNMGPGLTSLEFVTVGNPGNVGQLSGSGAGGVGPDRICGAVDYEYDIGKYEITAAQYCEFLNAVAATDTYGLYDLSMDTSPTGCQITRTGSSGSYTYDFSGRPGGSGTEADWANRPVNYVSWGDAARFANWLHNGQPTGSQGLSTTENGSYYLNGATTDEELLAVTRKPDATWVIPLEDEWYKAAYHKNDGVTANYFDYPTGSDTTPSNFVVDPVDPGNNATFYDSDNIPEFRYTIGSPYYRTEVGDHENSASSYGTFDQGGNL